MIKAFRLVRGLKIFNVSTLMDKIKKWFTRRLEKNCKEDPKFANNRDASLNNIEEILFISYGLKTIYLTIIILNISYVIGMIWIIACEAIEDFWLDTDFRLSSEDYPEYFITYHSILTKTPKEVAIVVTYYLFTSLSTVGFGDLHPRGDFERIFCALILLFGVAIFSYIMGNFIEILDQFKSYNKDLDDGDKLNQFIGVLVRFNGNKNLDKKM